MPSSFRPLFDNAEFRPRVGRIGATTTGGRLGQGVGEGLEKIGEMLARRDQMNEARQLAQQSKTQQDQFELGKTTQQDVMNKPEESLQTINSANSNPAASGMDFDKMLPPPDVRLGPISNDISKAQSPLGLPDIQGRAMRALTPSESAPVGGQTGQFPGVNDDTEAGSTLPSTQFGPKQPPSIDKLMQQAAQQRTSIDAETKRKLGIASDTAGAEEGAREGAKASPTLAAQQRTNEVDKVNALAGPNAEAEGKKVEASKRAGLEPDIVRGENAAAAGKKKAELDVEEPFKVSQENRMEGRKQGDSDRILAREKALADYQNQHEVTAPTRTMMEGAKMVLPHIPDLRAQAQILDKRGQFGPIASRLREVAGKAGSIEEFESGMQQAGQEIGLQDRQAGEFATTLGLVASGFGRVHGGSRGGSAINMLNYMKSLTSDLSTEPMFEGRLDAAESFMKGYAAGPNAPPELRPPGFTWSGNDQPDPQADLVKSALQKLGIKQ